MSHRSLTQTQAGESHYGQRCLTRNIVPPSEQGDVGSSKQSAACNATHTVEARLARWLLRSHDLLGGDTLPLTQEFLGQMLGVRRTSVSLVANTLQKAGLIKYARGRIQITDLKGLKVQRKCYGAMGAKTDRLLNPFGHEPCYP